MNTILEKIINIEPFLGEDGKNYHTVTKEISTPRKTFLKGIITGKYRGDRIPSELDLFDFEIYEAKVLCHSKDDFRKNKAFEFPRDFKNIDNVDKIKGTVFPKEKLPTTLAVLITANEKSFGINVLDPQLYEFTSERKYHQIEGDEVFGQFNAFISGYVFDYEKTIVQEIVGPIIEQKTQPLTAPIATSSPCEISSTETGAIQTKGNYTQKEYYCKNHDHKVWGKYEANKSTHESNFGCFSFIVGIFSLLFIILFLIFALPGLIYIVILSIVLFLIDLFGPFIKRFLRIGGALLFIAFLISIYLTTLKRSNHYTPTPTIVDNSREQIIEKTPIKVKTDEPIIDSLLTRYRIWKDYDGKRYQGKYEIKLSELNDSKYYKNHISYPKNSINSYDKIIYSLKENDKYKLNGVYRLFDSIAVSNNLSKIKFAEMVVSFVQDIPYALIVERACDPNLYNDDFTRDYLQSANAACDGNQRFGINTPVEFLANLKGDCDSRTLLLYTILSHYNYDVAVLSSEQYSHSLLGINLPLNGTAYNYRGNKYVLWETTSPNTKPGIIPNLISNLNNWRISLKSK